MSYRSSVEAIGFSFNTGSSLVIAGGNHEAGKESLSNSNSTCITIHVTLTLTICELLSRLLANNKISRPRRQMIVR